ncbi:MAG: stage V sporulation protein S [Chloroflexota bacterium]
MDIIKVASDSRSTAVAGAIAGVMREQDNVDVQAIGAGAVNQAVKAVAIAGGYLELDGIDIICVPTFVEVDIEGQERTAVRLRVERRGGEAPPPEESAEGTGSEPTPGPESGPQGLGSG